MLNEIENDVMELKDFAEASYLDYSLYVIMDRALPHVSDGLKPVQRRILYAMGELRLGHQAKYKKSARTIGDTLGKYHPHGDSACYEAMALMAQPFSTRYPLVDGQGNWGSISDPKSFAAMRYTESKMTRYAESMLEEVNLNSVNWQNNFDGTMLEPLTLPAQLPNILLNGTTGVAVGMATNIPSHNINEVVNACLAFLKKKSTTDDELIAHIVGPDFPLGAEVISPRSVIEEAYKTGRGTLKVRATYEQTNTEILITSLPHQVGMSNIIEKIDEAIENKKLPVTQILDQSDKHNPVRIMLKVKGNENQSHVINSLFALTDLEKTVKINLNIIGRDGTPRVRSLPEIIREWCECRQEVFVRKNEFRLSKVLARLHIVDGFLIAYANIEQVIRIIREEYEPKSALMATFQLTEEQAKAVLELRLRQIAKLEESILQEEQAKLSGERNHLQALLADDRKIKNAMIAELKAAAKPHLDERRTTHVERQEASLTAFNTIIDEPATVVLSKYSWIRALKGHGNELSKLNYKAGDEYSSHIETRTVLPVIIMSTDGRFFAIPTSDLPNGKTTGDPLSSRMTIENGSTVLSMLRFEPKANVLLTTRKGNGFKVPMASLDSRNKKGKAVLRLTDGDTALPPVTLGDEKELAILTKQGRLVIISLDDINESNKSQGVRLVNIAESDFKSGEDEISDIRALKSGDDLTIFVGKKKLILRADKMEHYRAKRARKGVYFEGARTNLSFS